MTDDEIISGYVESVNRILVFPPPSSPAELEVAVSAIKSAVDEDETDWAWEAVNELIDTDPERAWRVLLEALKRSAPLHEHIIGAGPLEELLVKHPRFLAERVAGELVVNSRFKTAFKVIYFSTEYTTIEDASYFNETLLSYGVPSEHIPDWRIAESDDAG
jgi:hypothetical protein